MKVRELAELLGCDFRGDGEREIKAPARLQDAREDELSFYHNPRYRRYLLTTRAAAVIIRQRDIPQGARFSAILSENPLDDFRRSVEILVPQRRPKPYISPLAAIDPDAVLGEGVRVEHFAVIGRAEIGEGTIIGALAVIGDGVRIGKNCRIYPHVVIYDGVELGDNVVVHAGAVLGADGFGYSRTDDGKFHKIPQVGRLVIEDDVEIGANTTIDRASLGRSVIGRGSKIDNLVQIGHNVELGPDCAVAGQAGIAGSCKLGRGVLLGGQAGLSGHIELGDGVVVYAQSGVDKSFGDGVVLFGSPARPARKAFRALAALERLPELLKKLAKE